eukprot:scaffold126648_cov31-Tisochrysis_lutea.AAC.6
MAPSSERALRKKEHNSACNNCTSAVPEGELASEWMPKAERRRRNDVMSSSEGTGDRTALSVPLGMDATVG